MSGSQQIICQEIISITNEITNWRYTLKKTFSRKGKGLAEVIARDDFYTANIQNEAHETVEPKSCTNNRR